MGTREELVSYYYQKNVHTPLMEIMYQLTGKEVFQFYAQKWMKNLNNPFHNLSSISILGRHSHHQELKGQRVRHPAPLKFCLTLQAEPPGHRVVPAPPPIALRRVGRS